MLFVCLLNMSYGYYMLVRFYAFIIFSVLAYRANESDNKVKLIFFIALALLFQPFFKVALGRVLWNIVDVVIGIVLIFDFLGNDLFKNRLQ